MANFPISGKEIPEINLREISVGEYTDLFSITQPAREGHKTMAKITGLSFEEVRALKIYDYRALVKAVLEKASKPMENDEKLSRRTYHFAAGISEKRGAPPPGSPSELIRWNLAEKFGWTLDYIDSLPMSMLHEYLQIQDGLAHARASIIKR